MAQNLQELKRRIKTAKNISQIAKAMEMISASKIKRAQSTTEKHTPYADRITNLTQTIMQNANPELLNHPYVKGNNAQKKLLIIVSPDKGLCGSLNTNLFRKTLEIDKSFDLVTIGRKAEIFSTRISGELVASFPMENSLPHFGKVFEITKIIEEYFVKGKVSEVHMLFSQFYSIFAQTPVVQQLLPLGIEAEKSRESKYIFEPDALTLLDELLPYYLEIKIYNVLLQSYTSEQAARMVAMQNAKNSALDIAEYLTLAYNKSRQEKITNEILDLANSA